MAGTKYIKSEYDTIATEVRAVKAPAVGVRVSDATKKPSEITPTDVSLVNAKIGDVSLYPYKPYGDDHDGALHLAVKTFKDYKGVEIMGAVKKEIKIAKDSTIPQDDINLSKTLSDTCNAGDIEVEMIGSNPKELTEDVTKFRITKAPTNKNIDTEVWWVQFLDKEAGSLIVWVKVTATSGKATKTKLVQKTITGLDKIQFDDGTTPPAGGGGTPPAGGTPTSSGEVWPKIYDGEVWPKIY